MDKTIWFVAIIASISLIRTKAERPVLCAYHWINGLLDDEVVIFDAISCMKVCFSEWIKRARQCMAHPRRTAVVRRQTGTGRGEAVGDDRSARERPPLGDVKSGKTKKHKWTMDGGMGFKWIMTAIENYIRGARWRFDATGAQQKQYFPAQMKTGARYDGTRYFD